MPGQVPYTTEERAQLAELMLVACRAEELIPLDELEEYAERRRRMGDDKDWDPVTISDAKCIHESDGGALRVVVDGKSYWIPKKLVNEDSEVYKKNTDGDLIIPTWLAEDKGLA